MPTSFAFTTAQLAEIDRLRVILAQPENKSQPSGAVPLYTYLFQCITGIDLNGSPLLGDAELARETMQQQLNAGNYNEDVWRSAVWLYGAVQVNSDNGAFSKVIRESARMPRPEHRCLPSSTSAINRPHNSPA